MKSITPLTVSRLALLAVLGTLAVGLAWPLGGLAQDKTVDPGTHKQADRPASADKDLAAQVRELQAKIGRLEAALKQGSQGVSSAAPAMAAMPGMGTQGRTGTPAMGGMGATPGTGGMMGKDMMMGGMGMNPMMSGGPGSVGGSFFDPRATAMNSIAAGLDSSVAYGDSSETELRETVSEALANASKNVTDQLRRATAR